MLASIPPELRERYDVETAPLGRGAFGTVHAAVHRSSGRLCALKLMRDAPDSVLSEVEVMRAVRGHKRLANLHEAVETPSASGKSGKKDICLVLDHCAGGELFDKIVELEAYAEDDAACTFKKLLRGIEHVHACRVVHRDLKPENIMLVRKDDVTDVKLIDFGLAGFVPAAGATRGGGGDENDGEGVDGAERPLTGLVGSDDYIAPEVLNFHGYGRPADMWSMGIVLYLLLGGFPPFDDGEKDFEGKLEFPSPEWDGVSEDAKDLVRACLEVDPVKRISAKEACKHRWFSTAHKQHEHGHEPCKLHGVQHRLKKFNAKRKFRRAVRVVMAVNRMQRILANLSGSEPLPALEALAAQADQHAVVPAASDAAAAAVDAGGGNGKPQTWPCVCACDRSEFSFRWPEGKQADAVACPCRACVRLAQLHCEVPVADVVMPEFGARVYKDDAGVSHTVCRNCGCNLFSTHPHRPESVWMNLRTTIGYGVGRVHEAAHSHDDNSEAEEHEHDHHHSSVGHSDACSDGDLVYRVIERGSLDKCFLKTLVDS